MSQANLRTLRRRGLPFFKADHPRGIDRYIDYFGGRDFAGGSESSPDRCQSGSSREVSRASSQGLAATPA